MSTTLKNLEFRVFPVAIAALVICGCPPNGNAKFKFGYWAVTEFAMNGKALFKNGIELNPDGTVAKYTSSDDPIAGAQWQQDGDTFSLILEGHTLVATVVTSEYIEGQIFDNANLTTPIRTFVMRFLSKDEAGLPKIIAGHWRITVNETGDEYGMKLNANGSVEDSPVGESVLNPDPRYRTTWTVVRGVFKLDYFLDNKYFGSEYFALVDSQNVLEGRFAGDLQLKFTAKFIPAVAETDPPTEEL